MKAQFVGLKHISGTSAKTGKEYAFDVACLVTPMSDRDVQKDAVGQDVHSPTIPDRYQDVLSKANIGKEVEVDFYFAGGRENLGYCALIGK